MNTEFSRQILEKMLKNTKFRANPSSGSGVDPCGRTDMAKLKDAFRNFCESVQNRILLVVRANYIATSRLAFVSVGFKHRIIFYDSGAVQLHKSTYNWHNVQ